MRLDLALIRSHPSLSRRQAQAAIRKGQVSVDGREVLEPGAPVADPQSVRFDPHKKALPHARATLPILYQDPWLLVVDKPAGLLAVPSSGEARDEDTAWARVRDYVRRLKPRQPFAGVVHRIDRDTSGALAFALQPAVRQSLRALFRAHRIERRYLALVAGAPRGDSGVVALAIADAYEGGRRRIASPGEPSRPALTRYSVLERFRGAALLEVELETGRQHQIRLHLAHTGLPILGDAVYGRETRSLPLSAPRQMLHARSLAFLHPVTAERVLAESPLPEDFRRTLALLRRRSTRTPPG